MEKSAVLLFLFIQIGILPLIAQNIVVTTPQSRNVVLEEFTGIYCGYCPSGHAIAQSIADDNSGRIVLVNIHAGGYAAPQANSGHPDFRSPYGDSIANFFGVSSYPSGMINRQVFPDFSASEPMSRGDWLAASVQVLPEPSPINVGFTSNYNTSDSMLTVNVEVYYRDSVQSSVNMLQVALLESNYIGYQSDQQPPNGNGTTNTYNHKHILRDLLTGVWGDTIPVLAPGNIVSKIYTYKVSPDWDINNCDVAVYVTKSEREVITGVESTAINGINDGSTALIAGSLVSTGGNAFASAQNDTTIITFDAVSLLDSVNQFKFGIIADAPADWQSGLNIDGTSYSDSALVNLTLSSIKEIELYVIPGATADLGNYEVHMSVPGMTGASPIIQNAHVISNVNDLVVSNSNTLGDGTSATAQNWEGSYLAGMVQAANINHAATTEKVFNELHLSNVLTDVKNVYYNVGWTFPALTADLISSLQTFMDNGGNLLICGQDIGWETWDGVQYGYGGPVNQAFYEDYMGATYNSDGATSTTSGSFLGSDPIFGNLTASVGLLESYGPTYLYPDEITPKNGAVPIFYYINDTNKVGGVRMDNGTFKMVYLAVGLEQLADSALRLDFIEATHDWFYSVDTSSGISDFAIDNIKVYPNPANEQVTVRISGQEKLSIRLLNVLGEIVVTTHLFSSEYRLKLSNIEGGIYFMEFLNDSGLVKDIYKLQVN